MNSAAADREALVPRHARGRRVRGWTAGLAAVALIAACSDNGDPGGPSPIRPQGALEFSFSGAQSGAFTAEGELVFDSPTAPAFGSWAYGVAVPEGIAITAFSGQAPPHGDALVLSLENTSGTGTFDLNGHECLDGDPDHCRMGWLGFDVSVTEAGTISDDTYFIVDGSLSITSQTSDRLAGTFSGTAVHVMDYALQVEDPRTLQITNGSFDIPLLSQ